MSIGLKSLSKAELIKLIENMDTIQTDNKLTSSNDRVMIKSGIVGKTVIKPSKTREIIVIGHSKGTKISLKELENCMSFTDSLSRLLEKGLLYFDDDSIYDFLGLDVPDFKYTEENLRDILLSENVVDFIKKQVNVINSDNDGAVKEYSSDDLTVLNAIQYNIARFISKGMVIDIVQQTKINEYFSPITINMLCDYYRISKIM